MAARCAAAAEARRAPALPRRHPHFCRTSPAPAHGKQLVGAYANVTRMRPGAHVGALNLIMASALEVLRAHPLVLADPAPIAEVLSMGDSAVNLVLRPWTKPADYWTVYFAVNQAVKEAFDKNGVEIPFPQLEVRMKR